MSDFVDIHCHALFAVDDGARDEKAMQDMLDMAYADGTRYLCFTPHFKIFEFDDEDKMYEQVNRLKRRFSIALAYADAKHPDLRLFLGNEIMSHADAAESLYSDKCLFLGNSKYALIEFDPNASEYEIENTSIRLLRKGIVPLIAHIERYSAFVKNPSFVSVLKEHGAFLQVNAHAITKFKVGKVARFLKHVFKKRLVDVVASDAHNTTSFPPVLSKAYEEIAKKYGEDYATKIFHTTPLSIILN